MGAAWKAQDPSRLMFSQRMAVKTTAAAARPGHAQVLTSELGRMAPSSIRLMKTPSGGMYMANATNAQSVVGYVGSQSVTLGQNTLVFPAFGNNFAAVTLTAMDQKPLTQSTKLLFTLVGKVENQDMGWNADRTSVGSQWGHGPTVAEGIPATVTLKTRDARHVWALDGTGKRTQEVPATAANGSLTFTVGPQFQTLWYEIGE